MHEMKHVKPGARLRLFYALSAILRASKARRGERDKYGERSAWLGSHCMHGGHVATKSKGRHGRAGLCAGLCAS